jgi:serine/threonine protein kinase
MGDVYRGRDTRLERSVAIKVLSAHLATDPHFRLRFEREARAISSLDHPNICTLFDVGEHGGVSYLVMQLLEGETLASRLSGPDGLGRALPVADAVRIAIEIASAVEAAHGHGIIHRDLKPANIFVLRDGTVKILDFGLAKDSRPASGVATHDTTMAAPTETGLILGTAAYMAPEQVRGLSIDKRADIWAFGCVLYQMLAGQRPFAGQTPSDVMAAILEREPDWSSLPPMLPGGMVRVLRRCLRKDLRDRLHDIADARIELQDARNEPAPAPTATSPPPSRRGERLGLVLASAAIAAALVLGAVQLFTPRTPPPPESRLDLVTPATADPTAMAISPDGRSVAFVASTDGTQRIWIRRLDGSAARELMGTENGSLPFWSPDGRSIGFFTADKLKRIDLAGGVARSLADVAPGVGGSWGPDGTILFGRTLASALFKVSAEGGDVTEATTLAPRQAGHLSPTFLPDGRRFLFYAAGASDTQGVYVGSLDGDTPTMLTRSDSAGGYVPGWVLFVRETTLVARRFDAAARTLSGDAVTIASPIQVTAALRLAAAFSTSPSGLIAYRLEGSSRRQLKWFDRSGVAGSDASAPSDNNLVDPELAPDGNSIAFGSARDGSFDLFLKPSNGSAVETSLLASPARKVPDDWSRDGRSLLFHVAAANRGPDIFTLAIGAENKATPVVDSNLPEVWGQFSPDNHLVAYQAFEGAVSRIAIRRFPGPSREWVVSSNGGKYPRWSADGSELYYIRADGALMAATVKERGDDIDVGAPIELFKPPIVGGGANVVGRRQQYDVGRDGRFLINVALSEVTPAPITVILNWQPK